MCILTDDYCNLFTAAISSIVMSSSIRQSLKGILTAGNNHNTCSIMLCHRMGVMNNIIPQEIPCKIFFTNLDGARKCLTVKISRSMIVNQLYSLLRCEENHCLQCREDSKDVEEYENMSLFCSAVCIGNFRYKCIDSAFSNKIKFQLIMNCVTAACVMYVLVYLHLSTMFSYSRFKGLCMYPQTNPHS